MLALPVNQICLFASMHDAPPEARNIENIKVNSFPGSSVLFSSVFRYVFWLWLDNLCHGKQQNGKCLQIFEKCESSPMY